MTLRRKKIRSLIAGTIIIGLVGGISNIALADPKSDREAFVNYFSSLFPKMDYQDFGNGVYAIDTASRDQWESLEEFPPYEIDIDHGESIYKQSAALQTCFPNAAEGIAQNYPYFDTETKQVITLPLAINNCLSQHGENALPYLKDDMAKLLAYFVYQSRGKNINLETPKDDALASYEAGKRFFYSRRGQLNMACAHCHVDNAGKRIRNSVISPALGHTSHFPAYRSKWRSLGTLHRRFSGCIKNLGAKPFPAQSEEYRNLEYFLSYMSNGIALNGPSIRN